MMMTVIGDGELMMAVECKLDQVLVCALLQAL